MNNLKLFKNLIKLQTPISSRPHTYYLARRKIKKEILDENYKPTDEMTKIELKRKQLDLMNRDRRQIISVETSIKYLESEEYKKTYRGMKVWIPYRRNHKGPVENPPFRTRNRCIVDGFVVVGSPCPICRDKYLIIDPRNVKLLEQFINPASDDIYECKKIQLCEQKYEDLVAAIEIARDLGYLQFRVPFRQFEYSDFYSKGLLKNLEMNDNLIDDSLVEQRAKNINEPTNEPYARVRVPF